MHIELLPCNSTVIQGKLFGVLSNGLLAELPIILDSFYQYHKRHLHEDPWMPQIAPKVATSVDNIMHWLVIVWQLIGQWLFVNSQQSQLKPIQAFVPGRLKCPRKQPWEKQTNELLAIIHTCMASTLV